MINNVKHINSIGIIKIVNVILILNCPSVPPLGYGTVGQQPYWLLLINMQSPIHCKIYKFLIQLNAPF